jgi:hypothetical protein
LLNHCFDFLLDAGESIAVRSLAMQQIYDISKREPEIVPELKEAIGHIIPGASKGVRAKARKILLLLFKSSATPLQEF